jgi:hypothetical protein
MLGVRELGAKSGTEGDPVCSALHPLYRGAWPKDAYPLMRTLAPCRYWGSAAINGGVVLAWNSVIHLPHNPPLSLAFNANSRPGWPTQ